jgi:hypothetical protein
VDEQAGSALPIAPARPEDRHDCFVGDIRLALLDEREDTGDEGVARVE